MAVSLFRTPEWPIDSSHTIISFQALVLFRAVPKHDSVFESQRIHLGQNSAKPDLTDVNLIGVLEDREGYSASTVNVLTDCLSTSLGSGARVSDPFEPLRKRKIYRLVVSAQRRGEPSLGLGFVLALPGASLGLWTVGWICVTESMPKYRAWGQFLRQSDAFLRFKKSQMLIGLRKLLQSSDLL